MERRKALALAATVTGVLGSTTVAVAAVTGVSVLGLGGRPGARAGSLTSYRPSAEVAGVVTRTKDVYDKVVVGGVPQAASARSAGLVSVALPLTAPAGVAAPPTSSAPHATPSRRHRHRSTTTSTTFRVARAPGRLPAPTSTSTSTTTTDPSPTVPTLPPTTIAPTTTTSTMPPVTTTTRPPGVPRDWPPGKPIPSVPPNCHHPELEDNGVWNCEDD